MTIRVFYILAMLLASLFLQVAEAVEEADGVRTVCVFPEPHSMWAMAGEERILLVGIENQRESNLDVLSIQARFYSELHIWDYYFPLQAFNNATVPPLAQATFPYILSVNKFMPPGKKYIEGTIVYQREQRSYQTTFNKFLIELPITPEFLFMCIAYSVVVFIFFEVWAIYLNLKTKRAQNTANTAAGTSNTSRTNAATGTSDTSTRKRRSKRNRQKTK